MTTIVSGSSITFNDNTTQNTSAYGGGFAFRNRIINGDMRIDQRNAGASVTGNSYALDRFRAFIFGIDQLVLTTQQDTSAPAGFVNSYKATVTTAETTFTDTEDCSILQYIEGLNIADLGWGTANAQTVTLSFWVRASLTGTFGGALQNNVINRSYPFSYTISSANTWEYKTITIVGETTGTWLTTNGVGMRVNWSLGSGVDRLGTAGAWVASNVRGVTGQVQLAETVNATWQITGVQLEKGSTATSFDYRPYGQELALCQRYYEKGFALDTAPADGSGDYFNGGGLGAFAFAANALRTLPITYRVEKRASPTVTLYRPGATATANTWAYYTGGAWAVMTTGSIETGGSSTNTFAVRSGATSTANSTYLINGAWVSSAEL